MWSLFQSSINPSICLLLMTVWKRGKPGMQTVIFPAPCWISRPAVSGSVPSLPRGFPPSQPSGESSLHAERQQFDSQVLVGHRASHTFMSESSSRMEKKKAWDRLLVLAVLFFPFPAQTLWPKQVTCAFMTNLGWLQPLHPIPGSVFFFYMIHDRCPMKPKGQHHFHTMCHSL